MNRNMTHNNIIIPVALGVKQDNRRINGNLWDEKAPDLQGKELVAKFLTSINGTWMLKMEGKRRSAELSVSREVPRQCKPIATSLGACPTVSLIKKESFKTTVSDLDRASAPQAQTFLSDFHQHPHMEDFPVGQSNWCVLIVTFHIFIQHQLTVR